MPRFFVRQDQISDGEIVLRGADAHHVARSLRMAVGDGITVCDMQGNEYSCEIASFLDDTEVSLRILSSRAAENEPPCFIRLFQALPKGDKLDVVIQKAVECGVGEIIPFESERCIVRMKSEAEERKTERRRKISAEAAKQCGRSVIPTVLRTVSFEEMLRCASESDVCLFCYEGDETLPLGEVLNQNRDVLTRSESTSISIVVGSEGGFSLEEVKRAKDAGMIPIGLGKRILRTETASGFVLSCLSYVTELGGFS